MGIFNQVIFLRILLKFKMVAMDELHNFSWSQKLLTMLTYFMVGDHIELQASLFLFFLGPQGCHGRKNLMDFHPYG